MRVHANELLGLLMLASFLGRAELQEAPSTLELRRWLQMSNELQQGGHSLDAARTRQAVVRLLRNGEMVHDDAQRMQERSSLLFDALRLDALSQFSRASASDDPGVTELWDVRGLQSLIAAAKVRGVLTENVQASELVHALTMTACRLAYRMRDDGRPMQALRMLTHAAATVHHMAASSSARAHMYNDICNLYRGLGSLELARSFCSEALDLAAALAGGRNAPHGLPAGPEMSVEGAHEHRTQTREQAVAWSEDAGGKEPEREEEIGAASLSLFHFNMAKVLGDMHEHASAVQHWRTSAALLPDVDTFIALGLTNYNQLHDTSAALAFFRAGQQLDPYHPFPYVGTATVYLRAGDHATALSILRHIAQPAGATGHYHDLLRVRSAGAVTPLPTAPPPPYVAPTLLSHLSPPAPAAVAVGAQRSAVVYLTSNSQEDLADLAQSLVFRV
jgi:tetratricopeptide (TPR) repeat protein